jgi:hypothetical protein
MANNAAHRESLSPTHPKVVNPIHHIPTPFKQAVESVDIELL